jgi:hypothetical protein
MANGTQKDAASGERLCLECDGYYYRLRHGELPLCRHLGRDRRAGPHTLHGPSVRDGLRRALS